MTDDRSRSLPRSVARPTEEAQAMIDEDANARSVPATDAASTDSVDANAKPKRRVQRSTIPMRIAGIETVPMTEAEFNDAAEAFAVLFNKFWKEHPELWE